MICRYCGMNMAYREMGLDDPDGRKGLWQCPECLETLNVYVNLNDF